MAVDERKVCVVFLTCIGATTNYFLQFSGSFNRRYRIKAHIFCDIAVLPDLLPKVLEDLDTAHALIYHEPDWLPYLGQYRDIYDEFVARISPNVRKVSIGQPAFHAFWPFHSGEPRLHDPSRKLNRFWKRPAYHYGDSFVLERLKNGVNPEEIIADYLAADVAELVDLDKTLSRAINMLEQQDETGEVKVADYIQGTFRSVPLHQTINHPNNRMMLYMTNGALKLLDCDHVPEKLLERTMEIVERPMPVHPSIARYFNVPYHERDTLYPVDDIRNIDFAEFVRDYVYFKDGLLG